jgi:hypothetical protein
LVAESFAFGDDAVSELQQQQAQGTLAAFLKSLIKTRADSVLKQLAGGDVAALEAWLNRNPAFDEDNVGYQVYPGSETHRVLLIYHLRRLVDFVEKRQLNPNASGEEGLLHKPAVLAFHVDPHAQAAWITRLQGTVA